MEIKKNLKIIDWDLGKQLVGGKQELAEEMLAMLIDYLPEHQQEITKAVKTKDIESVAKSAHKLHGATCYCGTPRLKEAAKELEIAAKTGKIAVLAQLHEKLNNEINLLDEAYKAHKA